MYRPNVARPSPTVDRNISTDCDPTINRESTDVSTNCWQTIDWQLTLISTDSRLTIGWQLTDIYWPTVDQCISADCRQTIGRKLTKIYRPTAKWLSTDSRPIHRPTADCRLPTDYRPNDHHRGHVQGSKKAWSLISPFGNKLIRKIPLVERSCVCLSRLCL